MNKIGVSSVASVLTILGFSSVAMGQVPAPTEADLNGIASRRTVNGVRLDATPAWLAVPANSCPRWQMVTQASADEAATNAASCSAAAADAQLGSRGVALVCGGQMVDLQNRLNQCLAAHPTTPAAPNHGPRLAEMPVCHTELGGAALVCTTDDGRTLHGTDCGIVARRHIRHASCECPTGSEPTRIAHRSRHVYCASVFGPARVLPPGARPNNPEVIERNSTELNARFERIESRIDQICRHNVPTPTPDGTPPAPVDPGETPPQTESVDCEDAMTRLWQAIVAAANGSRTVDLGPLETRVTALETTVRGHTADIARLDRRLNVDLSASGFANARFNGHTSFGGLAGLRVELGLVDRLRLYVEGDLGYALFNGIGVPTTAIYGGVAGMRLFVSDNFSFTVGFRAMMYVENGSQPANEAAVGSFRGDYYGGEAGFRYAFSPNWAINAAIGLGDGHSVMISSPTSVHRGTAVDIESLGAMITAGISWRPL